jgi:hypothetical protein
MGFIQFANGIVFFSEFKEKEYTLKYGTNTYIVKRKHEKDFIFKIGLARLTLVGEELATIVNPSTIEGFVELFISEENDYNEKAGNPSSSLFKLSKIVI